MRNIRDQRKLPELLLQFTGDGQGNVAPVSGDEWPAGVGVGIGNNDSDGRGLAPLHASMAAGGCSPRFIS